MAKKTGKDIQKFIMGAIGVVIIVLLIPMVSDGVAEAQNSTDDAMVSLVLPLITLVFAFGAILYVIRLFID